MADSVALTHTTTKLHTIVLPGALPAILFFFNYFGFQNPNEKVGI